MSESGENMTTMSPLSNGNAIQRLPDQQTPAPKPSLAVGERGLRITTFEELWRFANAVCASGFAPRGLERVESVFVAIEFGMELGIPAMMAVQNIAVINGRPSLWGDAVKALVLGSPTCEYVDEWFEEDGDALTAVCEAKRRGYPRAVRQSFSVDDAKKAGLWGKSGPWAQYPKRMLQMRARAFALRDAFPDVLRGIAVAEEAMDITPSAQPLPVEKVQVVEATVTAPAAPVVDEGKPVTRTEEAKRAIRSRKAAAPVQQESAAPAPAPEATPAPAQAQTTDNAGADPRAPQEIADEFATTMSVSELQTFILNTKGKRAMLVEQAMKMAQVTTLIDAPEANIRNVAFNLKLALLNETGSLLPPSPPTENRRR